MPQLATALDRQKKMSLASNGAELAHAFARHFASLMGVSHLIVVKVEGLTPGEFRLMDWINFFEDDLALEGIRTRIF